jgi:hypothetical protein
VVAKAVAGTHSTTPDVFAWPGDAPRTHAAVFDKGVDLVVGEGAQRRAISGVRAGVIVDREPVFTGVHHAGSAQPRGRGRTSGPPQDLAAGTNPPLRAAIVYLLPSG